MHHFKFAFEHQLQLAHATAFSSFTVYLMGTARYS